MKKIFILFLILTTSACTVLPSFSGAVDPKILDPVNGLLFKKAGGLSYIFFSEEQAVLIQNTKGGINSYYKLLNGEVYRDDVITYQLDGWGSYGGNYIGIYMQKTGQKTELGITIQSSRSLAINATKGLASATGILDVTQGETLQSPALYTLNALSPVVKTSAAGIFKPDENSFLSITDLDPGNHSIHAKLIESTKKPDGTLDSTTHNLKFVNGNADEGVKLLSGVSTIYQYTDTSTFLVGVRFDLSSEFPRLQIIKRSYSAGGDRALAIAGLVQELNNVVAWEYSFFTSLRVLDSSLAPFLDNTFVQFTSGSSHLYHPFNTSRWHFNKKEDSIRITRSYGNDFTEEDYLIGPTLTSGVFELIDFRNDGTQTFSRKFLTITSSANVSAPGTISTVTIANTENGFNNPIFKAELKLISDDLNPTSLDFYKYSPIPQFLLGPAGSDSAPIDGRSGFQAYIESDTGTIHLAGGYTNLKGGYLPSGIPRRVSSTTAALQTVDNRIWTIENITGTTPKAQLNDLRLFPNPTAGLDFQQMIGATTKKSQTRPRDVFWAFGAGAIKDTKFSYYINNAAKWNISEVKVFEKSYHQAMVAHNNMVYIMGGTTSSIPSTTVTEPETFGTFNNKIYTTVAGNPASWEKLTTHTTEIWSPRVHARVFSVGKTLVLVGGMTGTTAPTPANDVWTSENNGTNWIETPVTSTIKPPIQTDIHGGPLMGTVHNGVIYLLNESRELFYSSDKGLNWYEANADFSGGGGGPKLYGAQLVAFKDYLILIGGQTSPSTSTSSDIMEKKIYTLKVR